MSLCCFQLCAALVDSLLSEICTLPMRALVYLKVLEQFRLSLTYVIVSLEGAIHSILALYQLAFQGFNSQLGSSFTLLGR